MSELTLVQGKTLEEKRKQWEEGGIVKVAVTHCIPYKDGSNSKTVLVIVDFEEEFSLHRYMKLGNGWDVSVDVANSSLDNCMEEITFQMQNIYPEK